MIDRRVVELTNDLMRQQRRINRLAAEHEIVARQVRELEEQVEQDRRNLGAVRWLDLLVPALAWLLDFTLLSAGVEYIAAALTSGTAPQWLILLARVIIPAVIVGVELRIGAVVDRARSDVRVLQSPTRRALPWIALGVLIAVGVPVGTAWAIYRAKAALNPGSAEAVLLQVGVLAALSAGAHLLTLFCARQAVEAMEALYARANFARLHRRLDTARGRETRLRSAAVNEFNTFRVYLDEYFTLTGRAWGHGLTQYSTNLINQAFGYPVLAVPSGDGAGGGRTAVLPPGGEPADAEAEEEVQV